MDPTPFSPRRSTSVHETIYLHKDHLGSLDTVTNGSGGVVVRLSYDAFGKRRDDDWVGPPDAAEMTAVGNSTRRGFTFHEHVDNLSLIHMNGRVYDPGIGRFLSADPFVQAPFNLQSLNRYSYVFNNPLSYTDPSGFAATGCCLDDDRPSPGPGPTDLPLPYDPDDKRKRPCRDFGICGPNHPKNGGDSDDSGDAPRSDSIDPSLRAPDVSGDDASSVASVGAGSVAIVASTASAASESRYLAASSRLYRTLGAIRVAIAGAAGTIGSVVVGVLFPAPEGMGGLSGDDMILGVNWGQFTQLVSARASCAQGLGL